MEERDDDESLSQFDRMLDEEVSAEEVWMQSYLLGMTQPHLELDESESDLSQNSVEQPSDEDEEEEEGDEYTLQMLRFNREARERRRAFHLEAATQAATKIQDPNFRDKVSIFLRDCIDQDILPRYIRTQPAVAPSYESFPHDLHPDLKQVIHFISRSHSLV